MRSRRRIKKLFRSKRKRSYKKSRRIWRKHRKGSRIGRNKIFPHKDTSISVTLVGNAIEQVTAAGGTTQRTWAYDLTAMRGYDTYVHCFKYYKIKTCGFDYELSETAPAVYGVGTITDGTAFNYLQQPGKGVYLHSVPNYANMGAPTSILGMRSEDRYKIKRLGVKRHTFVSCSATVMEMRYLNVTGTNYAPRPGPAPYWTTQQTNVAHYGPNTITENCHPQWNASITVTPYATVKFWGRKDVNSTI